MHVFWMNRNYTYTDDRKEYIGSLLKAGEVHWRYDASEAGYARNSHSGSISWHWGRPYCGVEMEVGGGDGNNELELFLGLPWICSLWFHHSLPPWIIKRLPQHHYRIPEYRRGITPGEEATLVGYHEGSYPDKRTLSVRIHHWSLWWTVWFNDDEWHNTDPWYRRGSFAIDDFLLGQRQYLCENLGPPQAMTVAMLEGDYPVLVQQQRQRWWRKRWHGWPFRMERISFDVRCDVGIPFPGKGENSWDCEDDGLFGTGFEVPTAQEACERYREVVLEYRRRYGGARCAEQAWPQPAAERVREYAQRQALRRRL